MLPRFIAVAAAALLTVAACASAASPAPATSVPSAPIPTAVASPSAAIPTVSSTPVPMPTPDATAAAAAAPTVSQPIADGAGTDRFFAQIPAEWITIGARDIASKAAFAAWQAAHPEVTQESATTVADDMSTGGVALFAFDAAHATGGFMPNLNVTWIDSPTGAIEPWIADQAASITKEYALATPLAYQAWTPADTGTLGGFIGSYRYSMKGAKLAGIQMIVPHPSGRAAVLTFTCGDGQTDLYGPIVEALFTSLSATS